MNFGIGQAASARRVGLTLILSAAVIAVVLELAARFHWWGLFLPFGSAAIFVAIFSGAFLAGVGGKAARIAGVVFLVILIFVAGITYVYGTIAQVSGLGYIFAPLMGQLAPVLTWQYVLLLLVAGGLFLSGSEK